MHRLRGFTLIELLVVMAIVALLLSIVAPRMMNQSDKAREIALKQNLASIRASLDRFSADHGRFPISLDELVSERYIRQVPIDPMTGRANTWEIVHIDEGGEMHVYDVRSGAPGRARDGTAFETW